MDCLNPRNWRNQRKLAEFGNGASVIKSVGLMTINSLLVIPLATKRTFVFLHIPPTLRDSLSCELYRNPMFCSNYCLTKMKSTRETYRHATFSEIRDVVHTLQCVQSVPAEANGRQHLGKRAAKVWHFPIWQRLGRKCGNGVGEEC